MVPWELQFRSTGDHIAANKRVLCHLHAAQFCTRHLETACIGTAFLMHFGVGAYVSSLDTQLI